MEICLIIGAVLIVVGTILLHTEHEGVAFLLGCLGGYLISGAVLMIHDREIPTAMDVYQGKTTLEITYRDGVAVDSTVVFKDKGK